MLTVVVVPAGVVVKVLVVVLEITDGVGVAVTVKVARDLVIVSGLRVFVTVTISSGKNSI